MGWSDWIRDRVEVEPSLYAADFARLGEQLDVLLDAGCRVFHFDIGDGHFVPPVTIGPVVFRSIAPMIHAAGGVLDCHLMVTDPAHHFAEIAASGGDSVTFHVEANDRPRRRSRRRRAHTGSLSASRSTPAPNRMLRRPPPPAAGAEHGALHEYSARLLGAGLHAGSPAADRASCELWSTCRSRSTAASAARMRERLATQVHRCSSPAARCSGRRIQPPPTGGSSASVA